MRRVTKEKLTKIILIIITAIVALGMILIFGY